MQQKDREACRLTIVTEIAVESPLVCPVLRQVVNCTELRGLPVSFALKRGSRQKTSEFLFHKLKLVVIDFFLGLQVYG